MDPIWNRLKQSIKADYLWWFLIIALGMALRLRQYLANRSLWMDEARLALNIVNRTFQGLTQPLDYEQGSPIGFLFIEKLSVLALGNRDYVMRLFPLFAGILAVYLIYRIAREQFEPAGIFAVLLFATSGTLIYYSSELKQYSSDVMATVLLVLLATPCIRKSPRTRDFLFLGIGGTLLIWISHPAAFVLAGIGLVLFFDRITQKDYRSAVLVLGMGVAWAASFGLEYFVSLRYIAGNEFLQQYWSKAFMPLPPWSNRRWFLDTYFGLVLFTINRADDLMALIVAGLTLVGGGSLLIRNRKVAFILILPFFMALAASALQKYPLKYRFMLFLVPLVLLLMAEGLRALYVLAAKWNRTWALALSVLIAGAVFWLSGSYRLETFFQPTMGADIKPVLNYVGQNRSTDDTVYIFHGSEPAFKYYAPFYGLDSGEIIIGFDSVRKKVALDAFQADVSKLDGTPRVWFIFSDIVDCGGCKGDMQAYYAAYLSRFGTRLDSFGAAGAHAYLYDLSR